jgi:hypothetical protein
VLFRRHFALIVILSSFLATCFAADGNPSNNVFTVTVAPPTSIKDVQVRYFLSGDFGVIFSTSTATGSENKIVIMTEQQNKAATSFKAIAYAPGCQFVTFSVDDLSTSNRQGEFQCQKLPTTLLQGRVALSGTEGKDLQVQVLYVCNWATQFFNMGPGAISPFSLIKAPVAADGTFSVELPDFASDPLWPSFSKDAFLSFYLVDANTGHPLNALAPPAALSQGSLLKVAATYPSETVFAIQATAAKK